jgi:ubiquinone/menaquinone biosynthesis C-methylase UbiE
MSAQDRVADTAASYDRHASAYHALWRQRRPHDAIRKFLALAGRGSRVLDVACGPALDVRLLSDGGVKVFAGDLSQELLRLSKTFYPRGAIARWDVRRLPFPDEVFGGVWAPSALEHLPRGQIRQALRELRRVQRNGPLFVSFREGTGDLEAVEEPSLGTVHVTSVTAQQLRALLLDAGYVGVEVEPRPDPLGREDVRWLYGWGRLATP